MMDNLAEKSERVALIFVCFRLVYCHGLFALPCGVIGRI